jgi:uncharacterized protein (DUF58 family)
MATTTTEDPRRFLHPASIAAISKLHLRAQQAVEGFLVGMHKSPFFGHSVEFVQNREYVPGDDIRHLDWKAWSKTDRYFIKQYEAETNLRSTIVVDVSESMQYGEAAHKKAGTLNKYEYACTVAACLAYMSIRQQDSVGLVTFDSDVRVTLPPAASQIHLDGIIRSLDVSKPREKTNILKILKRVSEAIHQRGMIVLISDFLTDRTELLKGLQILAQRRHDIMIFHLMDDDELEFPFNGMTRFEGMEELPNLLCDPKSLREGYLEALNEYLIEVRRGCTRLGIDYNLIRTSDYLDAVLSKFLHRREAVRGRGR